MRSMNLNRIPTDPEIAPLIYSMCEDIEKVTIHKLTTITSVTYKVFEVFNSLFRKMEVPKDEKPQFDKALGGNVELPVTINIQSFLRSRIDEIEALTNIIETPNKTIAYKRKFPIHLRRRAMSQNIKRLPTRLREEKLNKGGQANPSKRPRRKYRRRPSNLLEDYNRRQKKFIWLETHIWHAKRFHMIEKWGYKLPNFPNDKSYRACYRATSKHTLIQDHSYYCCIELSGGYDELTKGLTVHTSGECGLTFNSLYIQSGSFEGSVFFYSANQYPKGAIGEIRYFWKPSKHVSMKRTLWLWCHPSFHLEVVNELIKTFDLKKEEHMSVDFSDADCEDNVKNIEMTKLAPRNVPFTRIPKYISNDGSITMFLLKDTLNRFCLTGPLSQALVTQAFTPIDLSKRTLQDWSTHCYKEGNENIFNKQYTFWEKMKNISNPGQLPRHLIFSSVVVDPRFTLPSHRKKAEDSITDFSSQSIVTVEPALSWSPIWSSEIRDNVTKSKLSTQQLNEIRSDKLVPGLEAETFGINPNNLPVVPILLIQNPGEENDSKPLGYGSGWDIIVPCGYGHPVWLALSLHGGRAGGLKESASIIREKGRLAFPPDTSAGQQEEEFKRAEDQEKYFSLPPAKRTNFIKLGIPTPFHCPWSILSKDWSGSHSFHVIRNKQKLISLKNKLKSIKQDIVPFESEDKEFLVPVTLILKDKGSLSKNAHICIPSNEDFIKLNENRSFTGPLEPQHIDNNELKRKKVRFEHKQVLRKLARKRHKAKLNNKEEVSNNSEDLVSKHREVMRDLYIPKCDTIKNQCSRSIIGFVSEGDFSFTSARTCGVGYISLQGLLDLFVILEQSGHQKFHSLVRNINTTQYRFASLDIII